MRVLVLGNSVALYVRPHAPGARTYGQRLRPLLEQGGAAPAVVEIWAGNSLTVTDLAAVEDRLLGFGPDVVVVNVGIVDCTPRILPQGLRRLYVRGASRWERLWLAGEARIRRPLVRVLGGAPALSPAGFRSRLQRLVQVARDEASAQVVCLGVPPTSARVAREVPGVEEQIRRFDDTIRDVCRLMSAEYLDVGAAVSSVGVEAALPDGIHFSAQGHARIAEELARLIEAMPARETPTRETEIREPAPSASAPLLGMLAAAPLALLSLFWIPATRLFRRLTGEGPH